MADDRLLGRRRFLGIGAALASSSAAVRLGGRPLFVASKRPASRERSSAVAVLQHFRSRPDLQPPVVTMHVPSTSDVAGLVFTDCHNGTGQQGPLILDSDGELVWFKPLSTKSASPKAFNLRAQSYKGEPIISWFDGEVVSSHGQGYYELYDSSYRQVAQVHAGNGYEGDLHEFLLTDTGTALFTCYGRATGDLSAVGGKAKSDYFYGVVQEVDVATGKVLFQWRSDEHISFAESYNRPVPKNPNSPWDYFHINSINIDPNDNNLVVSGRETWAFYKVNRVTGALMWRIGGKKSDFKMGPNTHFAFQHDVTPYNGGIVTIFDNEGGPPRQASQSRGLVLLLDQKHKKVSFVRQYDHNPPVVSGALGSVQNLPSGHCFIGWGESSYFTEYGPEGEVLLDGRLAPGNVSYRAFRQPWTGRPAEVPAIAVSTSGATTTVYASWNGSTETASWSVLGGKQASRLEVLAKAPRSGFETAVEVLHAPSYVCAQALDSSGLTLGRSKVIRVH
jgi:hypothetical protein